MGYRLLGYTVWHGGKWFLRRRLAQALPSRRLVLGGVVVAAVAGLAVAGARRS